MSEYELVTTRFGQAEFRVSSPGHVHLIWPGGLVLNRVEYPRASCHVSTDYAGALRAELTLDRHDWRDQATYAAKTVVKDEALRLAAMLLTPEREWQAALSVPRYRVESAMRDVRKAEEDLWEKQDELSEALRKVEELRQSDPSRKPASQGGPERLPLAGD